MSRDKKKSAVLGWDIGGAHLKAVLVNLDGSVLEASQVYCPLWRGLHELERAIEHVLNQMGAPMHIVTMTGELADIFPNRHEGVIQIAQTLNQKLMALDEKVAVKFYAANMGVIGFDGVAQHTNDIASMNWLASLQHIATKIDQAVFIDIGSTTTDIAMVNQGKLCVRGFNDVRRMQFDELVYTGVVRTPLMALAHKIPFCGQLVNVAAEHFATTADVYTLTADLSQPENMAETADGAEKGVESSARRIARMIGCDAEDAPLSSWKHLALAFKQSQIHLIKQAVLTQISLLEDSKEMKVVGVGVGDFLAKEIAVQLGMPYVPIHHFIDAENDVIKNMAKVCFPAFSVASLGVVA